MYLRQVMYQMKGRLKSVIPCFHKRQMENLALMVIGMVYGRSVSLPKVASKMPLGRIQVEGRVQRCERLLDCRKFDPATVMKPVATATLKAKARRTGRVTLIIDRSMINVTVNLLWVAVEHGGRALPLGWVAVGHEGMSDLTLQKELLGWVIDCMPAGCAATLVADREFHSIWLATWLACATPLDFVLRLKGDTRVEIDGEWKRAGELV